MPNLYRHLKLSQFRYEIANVAVPPILAGQLLTIHRPCHENPYQFSIVDDKGTLAIDLGVYGAPETFVVDKAGVIRFRYVGPVTPEVWEREINPVVEHLRSSDDLYDG